MRFTNAAPRAVLAALLVCLAASGGAGLNAAARGRTGAPPAVARQAAAGEKSGGTIYRGNLRRTGVYAGKGVTQLGKAEVLGQRIFKTETTRVRYWSEWFDFGGVGFFAAQQNEVATGRISPPVYADGALYFVGDDGHLHVVR